MTVCLLDENHEVIQEFRPDSVTLDPDCDDCSWKEVFKSPFNSKKSDSSCITAHSGFLSVLQVNHMFSDYGPGMRYISFEHGGQDTKFWDGWFGVRVTGSSVTIEV